MTCLNFYEQLGLNLRQLGYNTVGGQKAIAVGRVYVVISYKLLWRFARCAAFGVIQ